MASEVQPASSGRRRRIQLVQTPAPRGLRLARAVAGIGLLALSWATIMAAIWLAFNTLGTPPHRHPIVRIALYVLGAVGSCWLGVMAVAAVLAGAFCLMLALTTRDW
jgi:hypothetical protein